MSSRAVFVFPFYAFCLIFLAGCFHENDDPQAVDDSVADGGGTTLLTVSGDTSYESGLTVASDEVLKVSNVSASTTTLSITGDFDCQGKIDVEGGNLVINVSGDAEIGCDLGLADSTSTNAALTRAADDSAASINDLPSITMVVDGQIKLVDGFNPFTGGNVFITDSVSLLDTETAKDFYQDVTEDDCTNPVIMPGGDSRCEAAQTNSIRSVDLTRAVVGSPNCGATAHSLTGTLKTPPGSDPLDQEDFDGSLPVGPAVDPADPDSPIVVITTNGDICMDGASIEPPSWDARPPEEVDTSADAGNPEAKATGSKGRNGLRLNVRSQGKISFQNVTTWDLMDGADGQAATAVGNPATATGGVGGKSGNMKAFAAGGFHFAEGAKLVINPGASGNGGDATATTAPAIAAAGCPGAPGGDATATGGDGGDNSKVLTVRGFDPTGVIEMGSMYAGNGGKATAQAANGGNGNAEDCNGGAGGVAEANGGVGGDASYSGPADVIPPDVIQGGDGGSATSVSGLGGDGFDDADCVKQGGDGARGGNSGANAGLMGSSPVPGAIPAIDGIPTADSNGLGGLCGRKDGLNGAGGTWTESIGGVSQAAGNFANGNADCACTEPPPPVDPAPVLS
ncbi:MAG TPA: hypothetical protein ENJ65_06095, partial [Candidatus Tenderia electrophaga]|nr:hypothetical protein [Candidatus Tenderia electrophaga]